MGNVGRTPVGLSHAQPRVPCSRLDNCRLTDFFGAVLLFGSIMEGWMGPCGIYQRNKCGCWIHNMDHATYTYFEQVGCGVLLRDETFMAVCGCERLLARELSSSLGKKRSRPFLSESCNFPFLKSIL